MNDLPAGVLCNEELMIGLLSCFPVVQHLVKNVKCTDLEVVGEGTAKTICLFNV